ncbi:hypothetical protein A7J50_2425 [Pseudomonas antarctica]|uniref:Uncharacterized protein n=1 Tax=Pseudomonas antarctica TaxID=219572 RepID=A0A172Z1C9_9PSED|nr:DUF6543 domain-containing protein [Pseudomonas antarctica]ANF85829.1 hypothetical protein A7J50_2425 [Pseudomonas antarctica]
MPDSSRRPATGKPPVATLSIHGDVLEKAVPQWLVDATPARRLALKETAAVLPDWYKNASPEQRKTVNASVKASAVAQVQLHKTMSTFQDVDAFAKPLLPKALKEQFQVEIDVDKTLLCPRRPLQVSTIEITVDGIGAVFLEDVEAVKFRQLRHGWS